MDKAKFYKAVRSAGTDLFGVSLKQSQVSGIEKILDGAISRKLRIEYLAYALATAFHETDKTMQPIEEYGKGRGRPYGRAVPPYNKAYYGRGLVQLTWLENYKRASDKLGIDFVQFPEKVMVMDTAVQIMFVGMEEGWFTGKKLSDYVTPNGYDYRNARRIINSTDKAVLIAGYALDFEEALVAAGYGTAPAPTEKPAYAPTPILAPEPVPAPPPASGGLLAALLAILSAIFGGRK